MEIALCHPAAEALQYAPQLGCRLACLDFSWAMIQPQPEIFDFGYYDQLVQQAVQSKLTLIGMVSSQRGIHYFPDGHWIWHQHRGMLPEMGAWSRFLAALVGRYRGIVRFWEVWSEPNCTDCNPMSYYDPGFYRDLLAHASRIIRGADPSAQIILGGMWLNNMVCDYLDALFSQREIFLHFDIFSWHFYLMANRREHVPFAVWRPGLTRLMEYFRSKLSAGCPIWLTELGLPTVREAGDLLCTNSHGGIVGLSEAEQARWFEQLARVAQEEWEIGVLVWLMLADAQEVPDPEHFTNNLGLLRADGSEKPVAASIARHQARQPQQRYIK